MPLDGVRPVRRWGHGQDTEAKAEQGSRCVGTVRGNDAAVQSQEARHRIAIIVYVPARAGIRACPPRLGRESLSRRHIRYTRPCQWPSVAVAAPPNGLSEHGLAQPASYLRVACRLAPLPR